MIGAATAATLKCFFATGTTKHLTASGSDFLN